MVLLKENQSPRNRWPLGKVVATQPDDQDRVRSATVLTGNGSKLERPVNKLVLLLEAPCFRDRDSPTRSPSFSKRFF